MFWRFREVFIHEGKNITADSRKFEILVQYFLNDNYPSQNWQLTLATRDNNHDLENICAYTGKTMWAEAKYTIHTEQNIASRKFDSTLVSSVLEKDLIKIFFFSNCPIGMNTIERIKSFCFYTPIRQVAFVDIYALEYWIKANPEVESLFFSEPIRPIQPQFPRLNLKAIQIFVQKDSYKLASCIETSDFIQLYLNSAYIAEVIFEGYGLSNADVEIFCNHTSIFSGKVPLEIFSVSLKEAVLADNLKKSTEYELTFTYTIDGKSYLCDKIFKLRWAMRGHIFQEQLNCYKKITELLEESHGTFINLYGEKNSGKSYILKNIKQDLLKNFSYKIIFLDFVGLPSDLAEICRIIFTLIFDCDDLDLIYRKARSDTYLKIFQTEGIDSSFISELIRCACEKKYQDLECLLTKLFVENIGFCLKMNDYFNWEKVYFIDNYHILAENHKKILNLILIQFQPMRKVTYVISNQKKLLKPYVKNIPLNLIGEEEILSILKHMFHTDILDIQEVIPDINYLRYPAVLNAFLNNYRENESISSYYFTFSSSQINYGCKVLNNKFQNNIEIMLIYMVETGVPYDYFYDLYQNNILNAIDEEIIVIKDRICYPNPSYKEEYLDKAELAIYEADLSNELLKLAKYDNENKEYYLSILIRYFPRFYNTYFEGLFQCVIHDFKKNNYNKVRKIADRLIQNSRFYLGDREKILWLIYYLGFSNMHCLISDNTLSCFKQVCKEYENKPKSSIYFEAFSQIIDFSYWCFCGWSKLVPKIHKFRREWMQVSSLEKLNPRAYLTATNRMMVIFLATDNIKNAVRWFHKNIRLALEFNMPEHIGYTLMDFAKGIYHLDLNTALCYLEQACSYFSRPEEKRRYFDCLCEISYVKLLLNRGNIYELEVAQDELGKNQFWIQYFKVYMKRAVYYTITGEIHQARAELTKLRSSVSISNDCRVTYFITLLDCYLFQKKPTVLTPPILYGSYKTIWKHNLYRQDDASAVLYLKHISDKGYFIDPRAW